MKIVINKCFGGFGLSPEAVLKYAQLEGFDLFAYINSRTQKGALSFNTYEKVNPLSNKESDLFIHWLKKDMGATCSGKQINSNNYFSERDINRNDRNLVLTIEELGEKANTRYSQLRVIEIPDDIEWEIDEYDGIESIHEKHRSW